jgi:hypothetical protein
MLSSEEYQRIKWSTLLAAETADRVVSSPQTVYYDEEQYALVYSAMTNLRKNLYVVYSELDLFRAMFEAQISRVMEGVANGVSDTGVVSEPVGTAPDGSGSQAVEQRVGDQQQKAASGVEDAGAERPAKTKRPYRRRNKAGDATAQVQVEQGNGAGEVGGTQAG